MKQSHISLIPTQTNIEAYLSLHQKQPDQYHALDHNGSHLSPEALSNAFHALYYYNYEYSKLTLTSNSRSTREFIGYIGT